MRVTVVWGKETLVVDVDASLPPLVFKTQLFSLTGVPPERQKIMGKCLKSALLKGARLMMMGTADEAPTAPATAVVFVEDLPEAKRRAATQKHFSPGLENLGNTCYMNATVQCLYALPELRAWLQAYPSGASPPPGASEGAHRLAVACKELFGQLRGSGAEAVTPARFLAALRQQYPVFAATGPRGEAMQQDAEECWTGVVGSLRGALGAPARDLFALNLRTLYTARETGETRESVETEYMLKANITTAVSHLADGFRLALDRTREMRSEAAGRDVVFSGTSLLTRLPPVLTVQLMRFDFRVDTASRCKILREVAFPSLLDLYEFSSPELRASLDPARNRHKAAADKAALERAKPAAGAAGAAAGGAAAAAAAGGADGEGAGAGAAAAAAPEGLPPAAAAAAAAATGFFQLVALLTHKGRTADSGHYEAYVRQADGSWTEFDDDTPTPRPEDKVLSYKGGRGDDTMAYLMLYRSVDA